MSIEEEVIESLRALPLKEQREVLDFVGFLKERKRQRRAGRSLLGLWADLNVHITEEDIAEARREMWGDFPRDVRL